MVHRSNIYSSKKNQKRKLRKAYKIYSGARKMRPPRHSLNSLKTKWIQRLLNPNNAFWKDLMLY